MSDRSDTLAKGILPGMQDKIIPIGDRARITIGVSDVLVEERRVAVSGKERWEFSGSFGSLRDAASSFVTGRNVGLLLPEQLGGIQELIVALDIAAATVGAAVERAGGDGRAMRSARDQS